jgi:hypothetical protein
MDGYKTKTKSFLVFTLICNVLIVWYQQDNTDRSSFEM